MSSSTPYQPPEYLLSVSGLTSAQLTSQFEAFRSSLKLVSSSPELVFERVVANAFTVNRSLPSNPTETYDDDIKQSIEELQDEIRTLQEQLLDLKNNLPFSQACRPDLVPGSPAPIKFAFVQGKYGLSIRADPYDKLDGLYSDNCQWSDFGINDPRVQFGSYNTVEHDDPAPMGKMWQRMFKFKPRFVEPPEMVVWLTGVDMRCDRPCKVKVYATEVWEEGYDIAIKSSEDNVLHSVGVAWVAFPPDEKRCSISFFDTVLYGTCGGSGTFIPGCCDGSGVHTHGSSTPGKTLLAVNTLLKASGGTMPFVLGQTYPAMEDYICWDVKTPRTSTAMYSIGVVFVGCAKAAGT